MQGGEWFMLAVMSTVAAYTTSIGIFMVPIFVGVISMVAVIQKKNWIMLVKVGACMIPSAVFGMVYLLCD